ncbi:MAG: iron-sulfur cluster assembly scaffold protein [candidate division WOR-3 bacterium]|nr:MAG: iron-sulfur cluster assembly scaffold protein [candidate division WOR-3 bacterium]
MKDDDALGKSYSAVVIDHINNPRNWRIMQNSDGYARITGSCGDTIEIYVNVRNNVITECTFATDGCGATVACGSMVTEMATGKPLVSTRQIGKDAILAYCGGLPEGNVHCALLAANTLKAAIDDCIKMHKASWKKLYRTTG